MKVSAKVVRVFWGRWWLLVGAVLALALLMHLPAFGQLPAGLNRDEAALGYNAYSLLKTGKDERGTSWPISITSFGDQKLPGYIYTLIPFIAMLDLSPAVVRLPSFLANLVVIGGVGFLALTAAESFGWNKKLQLFTSGLTMVLIAISPWAMHFSRVAYEANLAMAFFILGLCCYVQAVKQVATRQRWWLVSTAVGWSLALLTYHSYQVFLPLLALGLVVVQWRVVQKLDRIGVVLAGLVGTTTVLLLIMGGVVAANTVKSQGITPFNKTSLLEQATLYRAVSGVPAPFQKMLFNSYTEAVVRLSQNYATSFSGTFFFVHGSNHGDHNPGHNNNSSLFVAPLLLVGAVALWQQRKSKITQFIALWFFLALVPASLTISPQHEVRMAAVFPVIELIAGIGIVALFQAAKRSTVQKAFMGGLCLLLVISAYRTFITYVFISPQTAVNNTQYHILAKELYTLQQRGLPVITQSPTSSPYIWYLFENKIDPVVAQTQLIHYPPTDEGFIHVAAIGNISFETVIWDDIYKRAEVQPLLLVLQSKEISDAQRQSSNWQLQHTLRSKTGQTLYEVWQIGSN